MPAPRGNPNRCPECNRAGSSNPDIKHLCKDCLAKKVCIQCGEPAYKYLEQGGYHSWYCKLHYEEKIGCFSPEIIPPENDEKCVQCGKPAYSYLNHNSSGYHCWCCEYHFKEKIDYINGQTGNSQYISEDKLKNSIATQTDEFVPQADEIALVKEKYGYER